MGWPGLTGPPGTQKGPRARAWAGGQARRPVRHGPQGTTGPLGPLGNVPGRPGRPVAQVYLWLACVPWYPSLCCDSYNTQSGGFGPAAPNGEKHYNPL